MLGPLPGGLVATSVHLLDEEQTMRAQMVLCVGVACAVCSSVSAAPSFLAIPRPYSVQVGAIQWDIFVTQNDPNYTGSLSVELPLVLGPHNGPAFPQFLRDSQGDDTNGPSTATWYYNETAAGSGILLWNITDPPDPTNHTQNTGANPF